jgi:Domain of unknown function (DUF4917)
MDIKDWDDIADLEWPALLLGNGASQNVSSSFSYSSLFAEANLSDREQAIFEAFDTTNFETALRGLRDAAAAAEALGHSRRDYDGVHERIRQELMTTLCLVHIEWRDQPEEDRLHINEYLRLNHRLIFSTNYDLLLYWAIMEDNGDDKFRDFFWSPPGVRFDPANTEVYGDPILVHYLHGGIHLFTAGRSAHKRVSARVGNILLAATRPEAHPALFISEGSSPVKTEAIHRSEYLEFALQRFRDSASVPIVVFGHALGDQDTHIAEIVATPERRVAVSVPRGAARPERARLANLLDECDATFFWADTHPLGVPRLRLDP